ncbi:PE family protein [Mycobacterium sp.]|uniref:PE family protein n=1 Tax=Mycobacterium sp. TaxID=1785 RepID=UPI003D6BF8CB
MSFVSADPQMLSAAAGSLSGIGAEMAAGSAGAAGTTSAVVPPAADLVSAATAARFAAQAQAFQAISAQAAAVHEQLVATLGAAAGSYAATEAANAATTV